MITGHVWTHTCGAQQQHGSAAVKVAHAADHGAGHELQEAEETAQNAAEQHRIELIRTAQKRLQRLDFALEERVKPVFGVVLAVVLQKGGKQGQD